MVFQRNRSLVAFVLLALSQPAFAEFNLVQCFSEHSKAECTRQMLIEEDNNKPLTPGSEVTSESGKLSITLTGENWLRKGWGMQPEKAKELGITKDDNTGMLTFETSHLARDDFDNTITEELKGLYDGLEKGFKQGKIAIRLSSQMEILPMTINEGSGRLGRFCYFIDVKEGKSVCVYDGYITNTSGETYKVLGSIGDYDQLREELESIIMSVKFIHASAEQSPQ